MPPQVIPGLPGMPVTAQQAPGQEAALDILKKTRAWPWVTAGAGLFLAFFIAYQLTNSVKQGVLASVIWTCGTLHPQPGT